MNEVDPASHWLIPPLGDGVQECAMDFGGARMRYLKAGAGPPLILLHGLLGYSFSWRFTMPALAPHRTVYAPDMLGAGFSDRPAIDHSMRASARRVLEFAERLKISSFDLLGTSRGGAVAMCAAADCGENAKFKIEKLILVAPVNPYSAHGRWMAGFCGTSVGGTLTRAALKCFPWQYPYWHARMFSTRDKIPADSLAGYKAPLQRPGLFDHALGIVKTWGTDLKELDRLLPKLSEIRTLLIWGTKDPAVYFSSMEPLARYFPNSERVIFQGVGHLPYEECPEEFNQALIRFLTGIGGQG